MPHFDDAAAQLNMQYSKDPDFVPPARWTRHAVLRKQERALHRSEQSGLRERQVEKKVINGDGCVKNLVVTVVNERQKKTQHRSYKARKRDGVKTPVRWTRHAMVRQQERAQLRSERNALREHQVEKEVVNRNRWVKDLVVTVENKREKSVQHRSHKAQKRGVEKERRRWQKDAAPQDQTKQRVRHRRPC
jgi:hypothetical protein